MNDLVVHSIGTDLQSVEELVRNVEVIKQAMNQVMIGPTKDAEGKDVPGVHYGTIPGCGDKHALFQPGAHKLGLLFNLGPEYDITATDTAGEHREYEVTCRLQHRSTGRFVGQGVGTCSTRESKYRYRWENTGAEVPKEYWKDRDVEQIGGPGFVARKTAGKWFIFHRVAHDNPSDYYNTVKKIAKKRAYNDAILTATAASDIFAPDDDTEAEFIQGDDAPRSETAKPQSVEKPTRKSQNIDAVKPGDNNPATDKQRKMVFAKLKNAGIDMEIYEDKFGKLDDLPFSKVNPSLEWISQFEKTEGPAYQ